MNTSNIIMERDKALEKMLACEDENHADSQEFNRACMEAYAELAEGRTLIHLSRSIQKAGLNENGMPKLAIARADRKQVYFYWGYANPVAYYDCSLNYSYYDRAWPKLRRFVRMGTQHTGKNYRSGFALVPEIPADVRPEKGQKKDWYILWEVEKWEDKPLIPPKDPYLLKHIRGELYAVVAEWNLTEVERAIMEEMNHG